MRVLTSFLAAAMLLSATSAWATTYVAIKNETNNPFDAQSYDWDDSAKNIPHQKKTIQPGDTQSLSCRKSWWTANGPGCYVTMTFAAKPWFDRVKLCKTDSDHPYRVTGTWHYNNSEGWTGMNSVVYWDPQPKPSC